MGTTVLVTCINLTKVSHFPSTVTSPRHSSHRSQARQSDTRRSIHSIQSNHCPFQYFVRNFYFNVFHFISFHNNKLSMIIVLSANCAGSKVNSTRVCIYFDQPHIYYIYPSLVDSFEELSRHFLFIIIPGLQHNSHY